MDVPLDSTVIDIDGEVYWSGAREGHTRHVAARTAIWAAGVEASPLGPSSPLRPAARRIGAADCRWSLI